MNPSIQNFSFCLPTWLWIKKHNFIYFYRIIQWIIGCAFIFMCVHRLIHWLFWLNIDVFWGDGKNNAYDWFISTQVFHLGLAKFLLPMYFCIPFSTMSIPKFLSAFCIKCSVLVKYLPNTIKCVFLSLK